MPLHPQDLQDFIAMFGEQLIPDGFEAEYGTWLAMKHRRGGSGSLGDLMIPLCRQFGLAPPVERQAKHQTIWRAVERGAAVLVTLNDTTKKGKFLGLGPFGEVEVTIEGQNWVQAVKPFQVELDTSLSLPSDLNLTPVEKEAMQLFVATPAEAVTAEDDLPAYDPTADLEDDEEPPKMANPRWYETKPGARLMVELGDDLPDAEFVRLGPNDGELVVKVGDEELAVLETQAEFA